MTQSETGGHSYVVGLAFTPGGKLALLRKSHPPEQTGRWNGPGGRVNSPDEWPVQTMVREFAEETGVTIPDKRWHLAARLHVGKMGTGGKFEPTRTIYFWTTRDELVRQATTQGDEIVVRDHVAVWLQLKPLVKHLDWIIPYALHVLDGRVGQVEVYEHEPPREANDPRD